MARQPETGRRGIARWRSALTLALGIVGLCGPGHSQDQLRDPWSAERSFLSREYYPLWTERYENYSLLSYRDYGTRAVQPTYDPFGAYLVDGQDILRVQEYRTLEPNPGSSASWGLGQFRNLVIMRDNYRTWGSRFMMGNLLNGTFSSLTLNLARLEGFRWDASSYRNRFSLAVSRVGQPANQTRYFTHYLYGGYWESRLGDVVRFGAAYVNMHLRDAAQRDGSTSGQVPIWLEGTSAYYLIISDDSPEDRYGVQVYGVEVIADGQPLAVTPEVRLVPSVVRADYVQHLRRDGAWAPQIPTADRLFKETDGLFAKQGVPVTVGVVPLEVSGTDLLVYRFVLPAKADRLQFRVGVAGDYAIDVGAMYGFRGGGLSRWSDWHNTRRAPGNVRDGSNLTWVTVDYGFPTGVVQYGGNATVKLLGATVDAEYVQNVRKFQFPFLGKRHEVSTGAYFVKALKTAAPWRLGAELFDVPASFKTDLPVWSSTAQKVLSYDLVEDNDDRDEWPDVVEHWDPLDPMYQTWERAGVDVDADPPQAANDYGIGGGYGVYPGLDENQDGTIDTNINRNQFPDYEEPFLMYAVESDDFVYGDDFNNNGVVDARENDNEPDYPYDRDQRGYHVFAGAETQAPLWVRVGLYRIRQRAGAGRNDVDYGEVRYSAKAPLGTTLELNYRLRRVRDDIADPVYEVAFEQRTRVAVATRLRLDPLLMQESMVNTAFGRAQCRLVRGLNLSATARAERNDRAADGVDAGDITDYTLVGKGDYAFSLGRLTISPMAKVLVHRRVCPGVVQAPLSTLQAFPIVKLDYALTENTIFRLGVQGLPGFPHTFRNRRAPAEDYDARHWVGVMQNTSNYTGYDLSVNLGFRTSRSKLVSLPGQEPERFTEVFIQARVL